MKKRLRFPVLVLAVIVALGTATYGILVAIKAGSRSTVNVYPVGSIKLEYVGASQSETQGQVSADGIQSVYISKTQVVKEVYFKEGDSVKIGDPLIAFDTTLSDIELKRQEIKVQQLGLEIEQAKREYEKILTYRVGSPITPAPRELEPVDHMPLCRNGEGTAANPYIFVWDDTCSITDDFLVNEVLLGYEPEEILLPDMETGALIETGEYEYPTRYVIFETRESNSLDGYVYEAYMGIFTRQADCGYSLSIVQSPEYNHADPNDDYYVDNNIYVTEEELTRLKKEALQKISSLEMDLKTASLKYETLEYELNNGVVYSKVNGVIKTLAEPDTVAGTDDPALVVSGGGGWYVTGALSETELSSMKVGDTVTVTSWQSNQSYEAVIKEISEFPDTSGQYYHYSNGNNNSSLYLFTAFVGEDALLREGEYTFIQYTPGGNGSSGMFIQNMFIRTENGQSYVYAAGENGRLEQRMIRTGKNLWGSYTEILSGLSAEDFVAFPYGRDVKPGAKTTEADISLLYNY